MAGCFIEGDAFGRLYGANVHLWGSNKSLPLMGRVYTSTNGTSKWNGSVTVLSS